MAKKKTKKKEEPVVETIDTVEQFQLAAEAASANFSDAFQSFISDSDRMAHSFFDTGSVSLNTALGGRGVPQGRIVEVWGPTGGGKTSLALELAWNIQNLTNKGVVFVDVEHKLDRSLLTAWKGGFKPELTYYIEPWGGEQALDVMTSFLQSPGVGVIVLDSVSGILPQAFMDGESNQMAQQAALIRNKLPNITALASKTGVTVLMVNQVRAKLEANPYVKGRFRLKKTGGYALEHWIAVSMYMDKDGAKTTDAYKKGHLIEDDGRKLGHWAKIYIEKNHAGHIYLPEVSLCLYYGYGFDMFADLVERAISVGIIVKSGGWYAVDDLKVQGLDAFRDALEERPDIKEKIVNEMKQEQIGSISDDEAGLVDSPEDIGAAEGIEIDASDVTPNMVLEEE